METFISILRIVGDIIMFPVRVLFLPFELLLQSFKHTSEEEDANVPNAEHSLGPKILLWVQKGFKWVFALPLLFMRAPFVVGRSLFTADRRDRLFVLPAVIVLGFMGFVLLKNWLGDSQITNRYRQGAYQAIQRGDFALANTYFNRLLNNRDVEANDQLAWASVLVNTGNRQQAIQIMDKLAPDRGAAGFAPAHKVKAINYASQIGKSKDPELLPRLKRHLDCCMDKSPEISRAWAAYYLAVDDVEAALEKLTVAAKGDPKLWLVIADTCERVGKPVRRTRALRDAKAEFQFKVGKDPLDTESRLLLAKALTRMERHQEAEQTLLTGLKLQPDATMKRALAEYYVMRYDEASDSNDSAEQFAFLQKSIEHDASYTVTYDRMTSMFLSESSPEQKAKIKNVLLKLITTDTSSALAHFALSNLYLSEGDSEKGEWHLERAYKIDDRIVNVINNLAWILAHRKEPDLDRALELSKTTLDQMPDNAEFLDTYASILLLRADYELAIENFEKALPTSRSKNEIHMKLAKCYQAINRPELAEMHEKTANIGKH